MAKKEIDIEIDRLTNSIEISVTGEVFDTQVVQLRKADKKVINLRRMAIRLGSRAEFGRSGSV
ncbi:MAG: hypothetical protein JJU13_02290 [Balneolaceae bacterium]|nr:hypothetical protein [Balneolaceae bacterium]